MKDIKNKKVKKELLDKLKEQFCKLIDKHGDKIIEKMDDGITSSTGAKFDLRYSVNCQVKDQELQMTKPIVKWNNIIELVGDPDSVDLDDHPELPMDDDGKETITESTMPDD